MSNKTFPNHSLYRDPLHGLIEFDRNSEFDRLLMKIIDTEEFQRMRRIRQLGLAFYAYQGAEHSRFTHSIGVCHLIKRIVNHLKTGYEIQEDQLFLARCTALLHDIGHGPFSHVLESLFGKRHEHWSMKIVVQPDSKINQLLSEFDLLLPTMVVDMLNHHYEPRFLSHLIASQLDADRFDYLLRDSWMTGVKYGIFDLDRLIAKLDIDKTRNQLIVAKDGIFPVEQYLLARHQMFRQVYQHKTVIAAEAMLRALLKRAKKLTRDGKLNFAKDSFVHRILYVENPEEIAIKDYLQLDDYTLWHFIKLWSTSEDEILSDLSQRLLSRNLFKTLSVENADDQFQQRINEARSFIQNTDSDPDYYILQTEASNTPYKPFETSDDTPTTSIFVADEKTEQGYSEITEHSKIVSALKEQSYSITHIAYPSELKGKSIRKQLGQILKN